MTDVSLSHSVCGVGEDLILIHGNGGSRHDFDRVFPALSRHYRTWAPDSRWHGETPRGSAPFTLSQFADDLVSFLDEHDIPAAHLLGFSDGANVALLFALRYPDRVRSLIPVGGNLFPTGVCEELIEQIHRVTADMLPLADTDPEAARTLALQLLMLLEPTISPLALRTLSVPTLVLAGTEDIIRPEHTRLIADSIPGSQMMLIPGGHGIAWENPDAFTAAVLHFLGTVAGR